MSLRQLRKLELQSDTTELSRHSKSCTKTPEESSDESGSRKNAATGSSVFLQAVGSDFQVSPAESEVESVALLDTDNTAKSSSPVSDPRCRDTSNSPLQRSARRSRRRRQPKIPLKVPEEESNTIPTAEVNEPKVHTNHAVSGHSAAPEDAEIPSCLDMERSAFDPQVDLRRMFGRRVVRNLRNDSRQTPGSVRSRRHWLIAPGVDTPRVNPWVRMVVSADPETKALEFSMEYTEDYVRLQPTFYAALHSHDPHVLSEFCRSNRQHPDGLLALSQSLAVAERLELAFEALREAVLSFQSSFHYAFSPFLKNPDGTPQVSVDSRNPVNRQLFACLLMYMFGLGEQRCHRCALELCKLLLAMDLLHDVCHALLHFDYYALRAQKSEYLHFFAERFVEDHLAYVVPLNINSLSGGYEHQEETDDKITDLRLTLPNFAFSAALSSFMDAVDPEVNSIKQITAADICRVYRQKGEQKADHVGFAQPHLLLMHALLLFPDFVRRLLAKLEIKGTQKIADSVYSDIPWDSLLFAPPLWTSGFPNHQKACDVHMNLVICYVEKTYELWRGGFHLRWLHSCASHLFKLCQNSADKQLLVQYKTAWAASDFLLDLHRYVDARISEFGRHPNIPAALMEVENNPRHSSRRGGLRQQLSLRSSPIILFFQTLLPWNELDLTGLRAEPLFVGTLLAPLWCFCNSTLKNVLLSVQRIFANGMNSIRKVLFLQNSSESDRAVQETTNSAPPS